MYFRFLNCIIYLGGDGMKSKFIKILGVHLSCLTLALLLSTIAQESSSKVLTSDIHIDELAPWG